ncbi:hypothetical protein HHK36_012184 [Tetracentron sinense]|uniref:Polygalacturonase n=1 Tax=Tetracentron sinense TaxID=13715 RepID=A0A835DHU8_TETSI|nr:hypothetical protein HHK36_012184 [Tetracentron sinense]
MEFSRVCFFCISLCVFFLPTQGRLHNHTKHKHGHGYPVSLISAPPSHAPEPASPSYNESFSNSTGIPPSPASPSYNESFSNLTGISPSPAPEPASPSYNDNFSNSTGIPPSPAPASPSYDDNFFNSTGVFDVRSFGAVGDGIADDTQAFKMAWDAACQVESAILAVPKGYSFLIHSTIFTGPCQSSFVFKVDGTLMPPDGPESWPKNNSRHQWLVFYRINGMSLQGGGLIDGRGEKWWNLPCKPHKGINGTTLPGPCDSPVAIRFFMSSNLTVQGLKIKNSPQFHFRFDNCRNVHIDSIHIQAPALSPNTDGIHIENTNSVGIYNSVISNGDDCVSIGSGCYDVDIRNITCGPSHGISIGSLGNHNSQACVSNITVSDSVIKHSDNGVRIKTWQGGSGAVSGITFNNLHMDTVRNPIIIDQFYCLTKGCTNQTSAVFVSDISYINIKGTYDVRSPPMHFACSDSVPCTNLTLSDVELLPAQGEIMLDPFCWNAYGALQTLTIPPVFCLLEGIPRSILEKDIDSC